MDFNDVDKTIKTIKIKKDLGIFEPSRLPLRRCSKEGIAEFIDEIDRHAKYSAETTGGLNSRGDKAKVGQELGEMIKARLIEEVIDRLTESGDFDRAVQSIVKGKTDPYTACENLVLPILP